jgi:hypothetical protein
MRGRIQAGSDRVPCFWAQSREPHCGDGRRPLQQCEVVRRSPSRQSVPTIGHQRGCASRKSSVVEGREVGSQSGPGRAPALWHRKRTFCRSPTSLRCSTLARPLNSWLALLALQWQQALGIHDLESGSQPTTDQGEPGPKGFERGFANEGGNLNAQICVEATFYWGAEAGQCWSRRELSLLIQVSSNWRRAFGACQTARDRPGCCCCMHPFHHPAAAPADL